MLHAHPPTCADETELIRSWLAILDSVFFSELLRAFITVRVLCLWTITSRKFFVGVEAVLEELDRMSDTETCSKASFDSVREVAYNVGEDPDIE